MINVALLGCGTVGSQVAKLLLKETGRIEQHAGAHLSLSRILVRELKSDRCVPLSLLTDQVERILDDPEIKIVIELLGGVHPAYEYIDRLLARGVHVVTANKTLVAYQGRALQQVARRSGAEFRFNASVCAAVPVLSVLQSFGGDHVQSIRGVINGTCNFVLTFMASERCDLRQALAEARKRGLVEPDPSADLDGRDAAEKLCIMAAAIGIDLRPEDVDRVSIEAITPDDLRSAHRNRFVLRQVSMLDEHGARVRPMLVAKHDPLAGLVGAANGVVVESQRRGQVFVCGCGAGPVPTALTILSDVIAIVQNDCEVAGLTSEPTRLCSDDGEIQERFYVRLPFRNGPPSPRAVLATLRRFNVLPSAVEFSARDMKLTTEAVKPIALRRAIRSILPRKEGDAFYAPWSADASFRL